MFVERFLFGVSGRPDGEEENDYDSADTDELFASRKPDPSAEERLTLPPVEPLPGKNTDRKKKTKKTKLGIQTRTVEAEKKETRG